MGRGDVRGNETIDGMVRAEKLAHKVYNITGSDFSKGTLVSPNNWDQTLRVVKVVKSDANVAGRTRPMGVCYTALNSGNQGFVRRCAYIDGLDTSGRTVGDTVYLSETAGAFTFTAPTAAGSDVVPVGVVCVVSASVGAIYFDLTAHVPSAISGNLGLSAGFLSADATGRALMATAYFDVATVLAKFAQGSLTVANVIWLFAQGSLTTANVIWMFAQGSFTVANNLWLFATDSIANAFLLQAVADGAFVADAATRALFANGFVDSQRLADTTIKYAEVNLTNAEMLALRAAPKTILAAPGAGFVIQFLSAELFFDYTAAYTEADDNLAFRYTGTAGTLVSQAIEATGFVDATADTKTNALAKIDAISAKTACDNQLLCLHNTGGDEYGGGNAANAMRVKVAYRIHAVGW